MGGVGGGHPKIFDPKRGASIPSQKSSADGECNKWKEVEDPKNWGGKGGHASICTGLRGDSRFLRENWGGGSCNILQILFKDHPTPSPSPMKNEWSLTGWWFFDSSILIDTRLVRYQQIGLFPVSVQPRVLPFLFDSNGGLASSAVHLPSVDWDALTTRA